MPPFWHTICLSLLPQYGVIWRTLRNTWLYRRENIKSSGRFFCFRKTFFLRRHCDSILTCNWPFLCTAGEGKVMWVPWFTSHDIMSLLVYVISGTGVPKKCRLQKLVKKNRVLFKSQNFFTEVILIRTGIVSVKKIKNFRWWTL